MATIESLITEQNRLLGVQNGILQSLLKIFQNRNAVAFGSKKAVAASTAEQLPAWPIPEGNEIVIKAPLANTGTVYLGTSKPEAEDTNNAYPLTPGASITYKIKVLSQLWFSSSVAAEGVVWTVEREG